MRPETWLESLFGNRWRIRVLRALQRDPGRMWTERELAKEIGGSPNTVNLAVKVLRDHGVLEFRRLGRSNAIRLRLDLALIRRLDAIFGQERKTGDDLRRAIRQAVPDGVACILFGSTARGQASESSDVDLLVLARTLDDAEEAAAAIRHAVAAMFPVDLSIVSLGAQELRKQQKQPWLQNAMADGESLSVTSAEAIG